MEYWGILGAIAILVIYYFTNKQMAKKIALEFMLYIEKKAEDFSITEGKEKLEWVVSQYDKLPAIIRTVVTKEAFRELIQQMFDEAMERLNPPESK